MARTGGANEAGAVSDARGLEGVRSVCIVPLTGLGGVTAPRRDLASR
jgi:hypothetical protein